MAKPALSKKKIARIKELMSEAAVEVLRGSSFGWLLDSHPNEWSGPAYAHEKEIFDMTHKFADVAGEKVEKFLTNETD